jgi:negative regulator of flagellin synthesis FlgM
MSNKVYQKRIMFEERQVLVMMVSGITGVYGVYQQRSFRTSERVTRAEEKRDYVALSTQAKDFSSVRKALSKVPDIRQDKVNEIRAQIESGNYSVSASDIADKMISRFFD